MSPSEFVDRYNLKNMWIVILGESFIDELFHDHDRLLFAWGQSEFLCLQKQLPCCAKVAMLPFWLQLVK